MNYFDLDGQAAMRAATAQVIAEAVSDNWYDGAGRAAPWATPGLPAPPARLASRGGSAGGLDAAALDRLSTQRRAGAAPARYISDAQVAAIRAAYFAQKQPDSAPVSQEFQPGQGQCSPTLRRLLASRGQVPLEPEPGSYWLPRR